MITSRRILSISILFFFIGLLTCGFGQEVEKKVHIKVIKNGETIIDTSFTAGNLDEEQLHKKIETITGENVNIESVHAEKHAKGHSGVWVDAGEGHHEMKKVVISEEEENTGESYEKKEVHWVENSGDQKNEKKIIVKVLSDKEDVDATKPQNNVKIIVLDDEDGTIVAKDDVKVIKTKEEGNDIKVIIITKKENDSKTLKETKQKKKSKRKNK